MILEQGRRSGGERERRRTDAPSSPWLFKDTRLCKAESPPTGRSGLEIISKGRNKLGVDIYPSCPGGSEGGDTSGGVGMGTFADGDDT